ncbi:MAG: TRAP transporter small permease subunit [Stappiaceae bacterium]
MNTVLSQIERLGLFNQLAGKVSIFIASCFIGLMTLIVIAGVFFRYVLNNSLPWVEDISLIMMVTTAFLVAPFAYRSGANVAIEILVEAFPKSILRAVRIFINLLIFWIIYRYFFESIQLVNRGWGIRVNSIPISWAIPYFIVPVAFVEMALVAFELIARDFWGLITRSNAADLPHIAPAEAE